MSLDEVTVMIGREGVAVPDPFSWQRPILTERYAKDIDDAATIMGEAVAEYTDWELQLRASELAFPFDRVDPVLAAEERALEGELATWEALSCSALEETAVLQGWANTNATSPELAETAATWRRRAEFAQAHLSEVFEAVRRPDRYFDSDVDPSNWNAAVEWVAVVREQAIREALVEPEAANRSIPAGEVHELGVKEIGAGRLGAILAAETAAEVRRHQGRGKPGDARLAQDEDISPPDALDRLTYVVGAKRIKQLVERAEPLRMWLDKEAPDAWVRSRRNELPRPNKCLERGAVRATLVLEAQLANAEKSVDQARGDRAEAIESGDSEYAATAQRRVEEGLAKVDELEGKLVELFEDGSHLDALMVGDDHQLVRAIAYEDEFQFRCHKEIAGEVERSVVNPPLSVIDLIGEGRNLAEPERRQWEAITREVERHRIGLEVAQREDIDAPIRVPEEEEQLAERIDRFREQRGMEPRAQASLEGPGHESDYDAGY